MKQQETARVFGERVREYRLALGLTQQELADDAGLHRSYIGEIELGRRNITLGSAKKIAEALKVDIAELLK